MFLYKLLTSSFDILAGEKLDAAIASAQYVGLSMLGI